MYHVVASISGVAKAYPLPKGRGTQYRLGDVERYARECFSHSRCDYVAVADNQGIVQYISHTGHQYF